MKNIVIVGAGGFSREVQWLINDINKVNKEWNILGFVDENINNKDKDLNGNRILGTFEDVQSVANNETYYVCAVGDPVIRKKLVKKANEISLKPATLIHPSTIMSEFVDIKEGTIICAGNLITVNVKIGKHVIINLDSTIAHDVIIEDYSTISPSVNVSGNVVIEEGVYIGTGTAIIQGVKIGKDTTIGAGAAVINDIPHEVTAVGIPAKVVKVKDIKQL